MLASNLQRGLVVLVSAASLSGCFFGGSGSKSCHKPQEYQSSIEIEPLRVPAGLDEPNRDAALAIGEGPRATAPQPQDQPCLAQPPDYFGLDSAVAVAAATPSSESTGAADPFILTQAAFLDERAREWNLSLNAIFLGSESSSGSNGSSIDISDDWGFGFLLGYNFTNHLALGFEMTFLEPRYDLKIVPDQPNPTPITINEKLTLFNGLLTGTYNILQGPVTPFVDLSLGWTSVDSNVSTGPPTTGCWWDPWWGYICRSYWSTYSDTSFSYGGGLGLRWDISTNIYMRAGYNMLKIDGGSDPTLDMGRIEIGWRR